MLRLQASHAVPQCGGRPAAARGAKGCFGHWSLPGHWHGPPAAAAVGFAPQEQYYLDPTAKGE
jgi:hypothetical protein